MKAQLNQVIQASKKVLKERGGVARMVAISAAVFLLLLELPVLTTPGNDIAFQWNLLKPSVRALMIVLALANGLLFTMHLHLRKAGHKTTLKHAATGTGILTAAVASTLACAACYSSLLAVVGLGGTAFVVMHQWWFAAGAIGLTGYAITQTSKKVNGTCSSGCKH